MSYNKATENTMKYNHGHDSLKQFIKTLLVEVVQNNTILVNLFLPQLHAMFLWGTLDQTLINTCLLDSMMSDVFWITEGIK